MTRTAQALREALLLVGFGIAIFMGRPGQVRGDPVLATDNAPNLIDEYAKAFDTVVIRTKDAGGNSVAEIHIPGETIRQQTISGRTRLTEELHLDFDWLAKQPGAQVVRSRDKDGLDITEFRRGGVVIRQSRRGDTIISTEVVQANGPPVLCTRLFLVVDLVALNTCFPDSHGDLRAELRRDVEATTRFIAENSIVPLTLAQSRRVTSLIMRSYAPPQGRASPEMTREACETGELGRLAKYDVPTWTVSRFRQQTEEALRVPRPPLTCTGL